jgi:predicted transcriptional regulator
MLGAQSNIEEVMMLSKTTISSKNEHLENKEEDH